MSICLKSDSYPDFFVKHGLSALLYEYLTEMIGHDHWIESPHIIAQEFKDKSFFQINKANQTIGFGAYKSELIDDQNSFTLYEFFVQKAHRSLNQLYEIRRQIIIALRILGVKIWCACVDNEDEKKMRAYKGLGFLPMMVDKDFLYMGMKIKEL